MSTIAIADMFGISSRRQELLALAESVERATEGRNGCLRYQFATAISDPDRLVLLSEWNDTAALDAHYASPEFASFQFALNGLLARYSEMTVYSAHEATHPVKSGPMDPRDADLGTDAQDAGAASCARGPTREYPGATRSQTRKRSRP